MSKSYIDLTVSQLRIMLERYPEIQDINAEFENYYIVEVEICLFNWSEPPEEHTLLSAKEDFCNFILENVGG